MFKIIYYYKNGEGVITKATLNRNQAVYAVKNCHDLNSLHEYISSVTKWEEEPIYISNTSDPPLELDAKNNFDLTK